jgi:NitT/TauT family transport system substrate-binding protein
MRKLSLSVLTLLVLSMLLTACGGTAGKPVSSSAAAPAGTEAAPKRESLKVGYLNVMDDAQAMLAKDGDFYNKHHLDVDLQLFTSGTDLIKAIVGGQLDAGVLGFTNAVTWVEKGADLKVIGGAQMGYHSILVRKNSGIKTIADLKGKRLASQKKGSTADIVLNGVVFEQAGLARTDVTMVYVSPAVAIQSLAAGQVDAAFVFEPYEQMALATAEITSIYEIGKVWPFPCMVVITSGNVLAEKQAAIHRMLNAQHEAIEMLQKQPKEAAKLLAKRFIPEDTLKTPTGSVPAVDLIQKAIESQMFHWEITPDEIKRMDEVVQIMVQQGILKAPVPSAKYLDLTWQKQNGKASHKH